jgi:hypothetical protein
MTRYPDCLNVWLDEFGIDTCTCIVIPFNAFIMADQDIGTWKDFKLILNRLQGFWVR